MEGGRGEEGRRKGEYEGKEVGGAFSPPSPAPSFLKERMVKRRCSLLPPRPQPCLRKKVVALARACGAPLSWMRSEAALRPRLLTIGLESLRAKLAVAADLMERHPPWRVEVEAMGPRGRLWLLWYPLSSYARLRWASSNSSERKVCSFLLPFWTFTTSLPLVPSVAASLRG